MSSDSKLYKLWFDPDRSCKGHEKLESRCLEIRAAGLIEAKRAAEKYLGPGYQLDAASIPPED